MVSDYNQNLWKAVLKELQSEIPSRLYDLWFKDTQVSSYNNELIQVAVPNDIIRKKIEDKYLREIEKAIFKCSGNSPKVEILASKESQALFNFEEENAQKLWLEQRHQHQVKKERKVPAKQKKVQQVPPPPLNKSYTFPNYVVGPANQLAHAAALAVAKNPGNTYNPLFMHGSVGLGKTHLLQAICHELLSKTPDMPILYMSCEEFVNQFIGAVEEGKLNNFRYNYRHVEVLVIDDIHFLAGKERTQEEFFHTFNTLYNAQKQIILSSDSLPSEIPELKERLVSRFKWGLVTKLEVPTFETRVAIVKKKSKIKGQELDDEVCSYIAENISSNIREIEGAINRLLANAEFHNQTEITRDFTKRVLRDMICVHEPEVQLSEILRLVAKKYDVRIADLQSKKRHKSVVEPRQISMYLAKKLTKHSLQEIGGFYGGRDHTTVMHAIERVKENINKDPSLKTVLNSLESEICSGKEE